MIVGGYLAMILAAMAVGAILLSWPFTVWSSIAIAAIPLFIGTRLRGINNIVHECCHASFAEQRRDNVRIGRFCAAILLKSFTVYRDDHLSHHASNGDYEHDAEFAVIQKLGLHDPLTAKTILRHILTPLTGRHLPLYISVNLSRQDGTIYQLLKGFILIAMAAFFVLDPLSAFLFAFLPLFYFYPTINFWTDCLDHAGLVGAGDELAASRNVLAPTVLRLLFFPRNDSYHLVHHLFPQIPARHLHKAHRQLCEDEAYRNTPAAISADEKLKTPAKARASGQNSATV